MKNLILCVFGSHRWMRLEPGSPPRRMCARCGKWQGYAGGKWVNADRRRNRTTAK